MINDSLRSGQIITTFGPGALLDLPNSAVILGGLDDWSYDNQDIQFIKEPRLLATLRRQLPNPPQSFRAPPRAMDNNPPPGAFEPNIVAWEFPQWFVVQHTKKTSYGIKRRQLVHKNQLNGKKFRDVDGKNYSVVPIRFVRACEKGHIDDIDWKAYVHQDNTTPCTRPMWVEERGSSGALADTWIVCDCGAERSMGHAARAKDNMFSLGFCTSKRPWLGPYSDDRNCKCTPKLLIRSASNAYFPQVMSVISIPSNNDELVTLVESMWDKGLQIVKDNRDLLSPVIESNIVLKNVFDEVSESDLNSAIDTYLNGLQVTDRAPKDDEYAALTSVAGESGTDKPDGDFYARSMDESKWLEGKPWMRAFDKIILVHRLREVMVQIGFTRFEAITPTLDGELDMNVVSAPLSREQDWLPAKENRGEGIFFSFRHEEIATWIKKESVRSRAAVLKEGFDQKFSENTREFYGVAFYMIHAFSHLVMNQIALECGYPSSSLRERIYASENKKDYGILIYTGSSDSSGTLGGLIQASGQISDIIRRALISAELCSNDPICAHSEPNPETQRELLGAACHGCLLTAETSCEWSNSFMDRELVVKTLKTKESAFFTNYGF